MTLTHTLNPADVMIAPVGTAPTDNANWRPLESISYVETEHHHQALAGSLPLREAQTLDAIAFKYAIPRPLSTACEAALTRIGEHAQRARVAKILVGAALAAPRWPCPTPFAAVPARS
ncbi:hypothetical protein [Streptomyces sp. NPDC088707]|uniref:hypothetical protein n=1 Tax=Streptomyces sp. NPDC088707 TaxID=3365871 RepID=UPI003819F2C3